MQTHNPKNERIKREYLRFLKEAKSQSEDSLDAVAKALARFEAETGYRDFRKFHREQAIAFKEKLAAQRSQTTGEKLSQATRYATLANLKRFFEWLAGWPGYRGSILYADAAYFNLLEKDVRVAKARREGVCPTLEQAKRLISAVPKGSDTELRNRALIAFTLLTGARDGAIASMKLKHVDLDLGCVHQDARDVKTKFSKTYTTYFFEVGPEVLQIVKEWIEYLRTEKRWDPDDPLFPSTEVGVGPDQRFQATGLLRAHWKNAGPIRAVFKEAAKLAGLPYFNPHSFRKTLARLGEVRCQTAEEFKAWSQNLGHEGVLTTFYSYGAVGNRRQAEIIRALSDVRPPPGNSAAAIAREVVRELRSSKAFPEGENNQP